MHSLFISSQTTTTTTTYTTTTTTQQQQQQQPHVTGFIGRLFFFVLTSLVLVRGHGGIPQGCPLSMMFIVALFLPWCRYLSAQVGVRPQLYADNLECLSRRNDLLLHAARVDAC